MFSVNIRIKLIRYFLFWFEIKNKIYFMLFCYSEFLFYICTRFWSERLVEGLGRDSFPAGMDEGKRQMGDGRKKLSRLFGREDKKY